MGSWPCCRVECPLLFQIGIAEAGTSNQIKTTRYNMVTFLPLATLAQFRRLANVYFLVVAILQFIPLISPLSPFSALAPLAFVLLVSLVRSGAEEIGKFKYDRIANSTTYEVYRDPFYQQSPLAYNWATKRSDELQVGEIIKINENERLPADLVLLATSREDGKAFIETSSLDGEKNLKIRSAIKITQLIYAPTAAFTKSSPSTHVELSNKPFMEIEQPHDQLYNFSGVIQLEYQQTSKSNNKQGNQHKNKQFIKINQFLYRNCVLHNTKYLIGVIAYAGKHTKTMLNGGKTTQKMSKLEKQVNYYMLFILVLQLTIIVLCGLLRIFLYYATEIGAFITSQIQQQEIRNYAIEGALTSSTYFILLNTMIPISLLVSIQIVKFGQGLLISFDAFLSSAKRPSKVFNSSINEELGMIQYIFTDKTGTLTRNQMVLKQLAIAGQCYADSDTFLPLSPKKMFFNPQLASNFNYSLSYLQSLPNYNPESAGCEQRISGQQTQTLMNSFMLLTMAVCHECSRDLQSSYGFQGSSPDEIALVASAADLGVTFEANSLGIVELSIAQFGDRIEQPKSSMQANISNRQTKSAEVQICEIFQFDSDRKRMSVILDLGVVTASHRYLLLCKGADNIIKQRLHSCHTHNLQYKARVKYIGQCVEEFSKDGLRTLMFSYKMLTDSQYGRFKSQYSSLSESQQQEKWDLVSQLETDLLLIGASGVEDKLQDAVPETIAEFIRAQINVCMLTGDKMETAENIAKSCGLFNQRFLILKIGQQTPQQELSEAYSRIIATEQHNKSSEFAIIVEGEAFNSVEDSSQFLHLFEHCSASVFCRITPKNKAQVVALAKDTLKKITLAIGDGANDVPMIMAANVGIGLYGNQGMNAVQASDFALPQFRFLWRLLFVHGRWNYLRIAELIKYFFYKNMVFSLCQLWFGYYCSFSGQSIYDATYLVLYNTIFTGGPVIVRALFEQDINYMQIIDSSHDSQDSSLHHPISRTQNPDPYHHQEEQPLKDTTNSPQFINRVRINPELRYLFPLLYQHGQQQLSLTARTVFLVVMESMLESLAVVMIIKYCIELPQLWAFSICLYSVVLALVTIRICYDITYWTTLLVLSFLLTSILPFILFVYVMSIAELQLAGTFVEIVKLPDFFLVVGLGVGAGATIQIAFSTLSKYYFPTVVDFVRRQAKNMVQAKRKSRGQRGNGFRQNGSKDNRQKQRDYELSNRSIASIHKHKYDQIQLAEYGRVGKQMHQQ